MALQVKLLQTGFGEQDLEQQLLDTLSSYGVAVEDTYVLPYGDNKEKGMILIFEVP